VAPPISPASFDLNDVIERVSYAWQSTAGHDVGVQGKTYSAHLEKNQLRFSPLRPAASSHDVTFDPKLTDDASSSPLPPQSAAQPSTLHPDAATLTLTPTSVERGNEALGGLSSSSAEWSVVGNTAQALLSPPCAVVAHFEARAEGVALTWVCATPPPGAGPLLVAAELSGLSYLCQTATGHHFADASGTARVRVGQVTIVDAAGRTWPAATTVSGQSLRIEVPATILVEAHYPLAIDPVIGPEFGIDNPLIAPAPGEYHPAVAASADNYLVVWEDTRHAQWPEYSTDIYGARINTNGSLIDMTGIPICTTPGNQRAPQVAAGEGGYLVVWADDRNGADIYGTPVSSGGVVGRPEGIPICAAVGEQANPAVSANSNSFLVVWADARAGTGPHLYGTRVSRAGLVLNESGFPIGPQFGSQGAPTVGSNGDDFLVAWHDATSVLYRTIHAARITSAGVVADPDAIPISTRAGVQISPSVASDGHDYLVVWNDNRNSASGFDIYGARVTSAGSVSDPDGIAICTAPAEQYVPTIGAGSEGYLVAWLDHRNGRSGSFDIYGTRLTWAGVVQDVDGIAISLATRDNAATASPRVAACGNRFLVAWADESIFAKQVSHDGAVLGSEPIAVGQSAQREEVPATASNGQDHLVVWWHGRGSHIVGARVAGNGTVLDPDGLTISKDGASGRPRVASDGNDFLVVWSQGGVWGARVSRAGTVLDPGAIAVSRLFGSTSPASIASNGRNYLIVWSYSFVPDDDSLPASPSHIHGTRLSPDGNLLDENELEFTDGEGNQTSPKVASNGAEYLVVWEEGGIYAQRINNAGVAIGRSPIPVCTREGCTSDFALASNGRDYLVAWTDTRNFNTHDLDIYGARITADGRVLDEHGFAISAAAAEQSQPAVASNGSDYLVVWSDTRNQGATGRDIYGTCVNDAGLVGVPAGLPINQREFDQQLPDVSYGGHGRFLVVSQGFPDSSIRTVANLVSGLSPSPHLHVRCETAGRVTVSWVAQEPGRYQVQFTSGLNADDWADLGSELSATGPVTVEDNMTADLRFYRVVRREY
jgi:hypothetical protein